MENNTQLHAYQNRMVAQDNEQTDVEILSILGATQIEEDGTEIHFHFNDYDMTIDRAEIDKKLTGEELMRWSTWWSCCGDELDHDNPICSICKEHN